MKKTLLFVVVLLCVMGCAFAAETTYTGTLDETIVIDAPGEHTLVFNGVTIDGSGNHGEEFPPMIIKSPATKVTIILMNGTENTLSGGRTKGYAGIANNGVDIVIRCESTDARHQCDENCGQLSVGGGYGGAGIGGDRYADMSGSVTINGGNLTVAGGGTAAGIGGGGQGNLSGSVIINGGTVVARGGFATSHYYRGAAGIGGGKEGSLLGSVTINGGEIDIESGMDGAGIGGGWHGDLSGTVVITGGNVVTSAVHLYGSTSSGAGIGGGVGGNMSGAVTISGGYVRVGGNLPAGAGIGGVLMSGSILISGGEVEALTGYSGRSIGGIVETSGTVLFTGGELTTYAIKGDNTWFNDMVYVSGTVAHKMIVDPAVGLIKVDAGETCHKDGPYDDGLMTKDVSALEGSPYAKRTDISDLIKNKSYAHFVVVIPDATPVPPTPTPAPVPAVPETGDGTNLPLLAVLAVIGMIGVTVILRRKNEA